LGVREITPVYDEDKDLAVTILVEAIKGLQAEVRFNPPITIKR